MNYISTFSGIEAASVAWKDLDFEPVAFSEILPFQSELLKQHYPNVPNLGDITKIDWSEYRDKIDLVVGGSPCFVAGSLVLTEKGYVPIENIKVGDLVVTHKGRLRKVLATGSKIAETIILKGQGTDSIECTPNHPFYATPSIDNKQFSWIPAKELQGKYWFNLSRVNGAEIVAHPILNKKKLQQEVDSSQYTENGWCGKVREILPGRTTRVYNLEVKEDNSYTIDGVAVHNCQSFSTAAAFHDESQRGLKGKSGLMFEYIRCVEEVNPKYFLWENVPAALTSENGRAFATLLTSCQDLGYSMCWRVLDATNFGTPQTRRRIFLLGAKNPKIPPIVMLDEKNCFGEKEEFKCEPKAWGIEGSRVNRNDKWINEMRVCAMEERIGTVTAGFASHVIVSENGASRISRTEMERLFGFSVGYVQDVEFNGKKPNYKQVQQALGNSFCIGPVRWIGKRLEKADKFLG